MLNGKLIQTDACTKYRFDESVEFMFSSYLAARSFQHQKDINSQSKKFD